MIYNLRFNILNRYFTILILSAKVIHCYSTGLLYKVPTDRNVVIKKVNKGLLFCYAHIENLFISSKKT
jgi:hypothetical protein